MKKKCISYSLFGYGKERNANCFDFSSYIRGLMINVRMNRLIFPGWEIVLHTDQPTYNAFELLFTQTKGLRVVVCENAPLCLAMLWRMKPVFEMNEDDSWKYSHVLCRDLDSPPTYREAQAVRYWMNRDKAMHAITDSVSHNLPLLGGMIGINPNYFTGRAPKTWGNMIMLGNGMSFENKGSDQTFLNQFIYPLFGTKGNESITQHYVLGHGNTFLNDWHNEIQDLELFDVPFEMRESNSTCGHIGAAGNYSTPTFHFLQKHKIFFEDILEVEKNYPTLFYWTQDGTFE